MCELEKRRLNKLLSHKLHCVPLCNVINLIILSFKGELFFLPGSMLDEASSLSLPGGIKLLLINP